MTYTQLDGGKYDGLQKDLTKRKGSVLQKEFIEATRSNDSFVAFVRDRVDSVEGDDVPVLAADGTLTENEYKETPADTEESLYQTWSTVAPKQACNVSFWGEVTLRHLESKRLESCFLAANGESASDDKSGKKRIDQVLKKSKPSDIDSCVRTILRRLSGLTERGHRTVFVDCPFSRAWWRRRLLEETAKATGMDASHFERVVYQNLTYWGNLVTLVVSRNSILGAAKARHALIWALADIRQEEPKHKLLQSANMLDKACRLLGIRCAWQEFGILALAEIKQIIEEEILPQVNQLDAGE